MIRAIVRPEKENDVVLALEAKGFPALTKANVFGRGQQGGIQVGDVHYDELPKLMLMIVVPDHDLEKVIGVILESAKIGCQGDGRIFVTPVLEAYTIRTGEKTSDPK